MFEDFEVWLLLLGGSKMLGDRNEAVVVLVIEVKC